MFLKTNPNQKLTDILAFVLPYFANKIILCRNFIVNFKTQDFFNIKQHFIYFKDIIKIMKKNPYLLKLPTEIYGESFMTITKGTNKK